MNIENKAQKRLADNVFLLGEFFGQDVVVTTSRQSAFDGFARYTPLPCLHLSIADDAEATWSIWDSKKIGLIYHVIACAEERMQDLVKHFFGVTLAFSDAAWRFEINSSNATHWQTPHAHLLVGHKNLFGENGLVRQCVNSALRPEMLIAEAIEAREQEVARALISA